MNERYSRNRLYVTEDEQQQIKNTKILLGGAGIGSIIAECALRFGFENITIVDGDKVEESNLNRQNYSNSDIGKYKAACLKKRLMDINPHANIAHHNVYIDRDNVESLIEGHDVAVNALDLKSDIPFYFDELCSQKNIPVLHPYNFGWAGFLAIVKPGGHQLTDITTDYRQFEISMARFILRCFELRNMPILWMEDILDRYGKEECEMPYYPQLSIGSWIAASHCVNAMFNLATGKYVRTFPKFYISSIVEDAPMPYSRQ